MATRLRVTGRETLESDDPARQLICAVLLRAVRDWRALQRDRALFSWYYSTDWNRLEWERIGVFGARAHLVEFFRSREFRGMCEWVDLDPDAVLSALGMNAGLHFAQDMYNGDG